MNESNVLGILGILVSLVLFCVGTPTSKKKRYRIAAVIFAASLLVLAASRLLSGGERSSGSLVFNIPIILGNENTINNQPETVINTSAESAPIAAVPTPASTPAPTSIPTLTPTPTPTPVPTSSTGVALEYPKDKEYFDAPFYRYVATSPAGNSAIYLLPKPESGNGNLGKVYDGQTVWIFAERGSYYFFKTGDGRQGWSAKKYFTS